MAAKEQKIQPTYMRIIPITGIKTCTSISLSLSRCGESGTDFVEMAAWHITDDGDYFQFEEIHCEDRDILLWIISSYSELAAVSWVNSYTF